jgi:alkanesulfonate monooxygenase SsuD/methylene tetrahydromethanopterin reductase-like flavin-dependent oxidoreductase (luciferase family)
MQFGVVMRTDVPLDTIPELASLAEESGWDGFFIWDSFAGQDPWVLLTAVAMRTQRLRFGPLVTAPSRRRPWQLASETATLDHLSHGRVILPVGLGAADDLGFARFGEATDRKTRASLLDESIDILYGLWNGEPFSYKGIHHRLREASFQLRPLQSPHIPIWVVAAWPGTRSMARALRCNGIIPVIRTADGISYTVRPDDIRAIAAYVKKHRTQPSDFDLVVEGETSGEDQQESRRLVDSYSEAGATWWLEDLASSPFRRAGLEGVRRRIRQGPSR